MTDQQDITIVLADDHAVVRSGLRLLLDQAGGLQVVSEAGDAESALRTVLGHKPSVLVLDLNMPGELTSLEAIPKVAEASPGTRVVVLTMQEDPEFARRALQAGPRAAPTRARAAAPAAGGPGGRRGRRGPRGGRCGGGGGPGGPPAARSGPAPRATSSRRRPPRSSSRPCAAPRPATRTSTRA